MTDDTLRTMVAFFPIMLLIATVESRAIRGRTTFRGGIVWVGLAGTLAAGTGVVMSILELWARENRWGWGDTAQLLWWLALSSGLTSVIIGTTIFGEWLRELTGRHS